MIPTWLSFSISPSFLPSGFALFNSFFPTPIPYLPTEAGLLSISMAGRQERPSPACAGRSDLRIRPLIVLPMMLAGGP